MLIVDIVLVIEHGVQYGEGNRQRWRLRSISNIRGRLVSFETLRAPHVRQRGPMAKLKKLEDRRIRRTRALLQEQREALAASRNGARALTFSRAMLEHASESLPLWRALAGRESGAIVLARIHDMLAELARNDL